MISFTKTVSFILETVLALTLLILEQINLSSITLSIIYLILIYGFIFTASINLIFSVISTIRKTHKISHIVSLCVTCSCLLLTLITKIQSINNISIDFAILTVLSRLVFLLIEKYEQANKFSGFIEKLFSNPARTILLSFVVVILTGTILLMTDFCSVTNKGLSFLDALFTATSAVCVTGLVVVDTATYFTFWGQLVLIILIQVGGLGLMVLSFFTIYLLKRRVSVENKMLISYMLNEDDTANLFKALSSIVVTTIYIELTGAVILFIGFLPHMGFSIQTVWFAIFHSISAFCNAGFALFSDSLESFRLNPIITLGISALIIIGGIGFSFIHNFSAVIKERIHRFISGKKGIYKEKLTINNSVVFIVTIVLLTIGTFVFYILEYRTTMSSYSLGEQYMAAFFQSVTFRTAGFNSVPLNALKPATYIIFSVFMFIGAASGSTAGGIKVNTIAILIAYFRSLIKGDKHTMIGRYEISSDKILRAFVILTSGLILASLAFIFLMITESFSAEKLFFEVASAIGTAGVTSGITSEITIFGRIILILLMFWGRVGALTIMTAASTNHENTNIRWPQADIALG